MTEISPSARPVAWCSKFCELSSEKLHLSFCITDLCLSHVNLAHTVENNETATTASNYHGLALLGNLFVRLLGQELLQILQGARLRNFQLFDLK